MYGVLRWVMVQLVWQNPILTSWIPLPFSLKVEVHLHNRCCSLKRQALIPWSRIKRMPGKGRLYNPIGLGQSSCR